jgi:hypothetical protein
MRSDIEKRNVAEGKTGLVLSVLSSFINTSRDWVMPTSKKNKLSLFPRLENQDWSLKKVGDAGAYRSSVRSDRRRRRPKWMWSMIPWRN